ncbi:GNAT family N-acetyltransferase [Ornithinibacillus bavariensis]|uniref:GNAT family N-acetyltransferase n=1 Tax=Ornithinibacillus bavariensis TaxID=545502 RepID=UPI003D22C3F8
MMNILWKNLFKSYYIYFNKLDNPNLFFYVGEENGQPVSYGRNLILDKKVCFLSDEFTSNTHRGKGMAKALCGKILMDAVREGAVKSELATT